MLGVERLPRILFGVKAFLPATFFKSAVRSRNPAGCRPCGSLATTHGVCMIIARQVEGNIQAGEKCIMDRACCPNDFSGYGRTSAKRGSFSFLRNLALRRSAATSNRSDFDFGNRPDRPDPRSFRQGREQCLGPPRQLGKGATSETYQYSSLTPFLLYDKKDRRRPFEETETCIDSRVQSKGYFQGVRFVIARDQQWPCRKRPTENTGGARAIAAASGQRFRQRKSHHCGRLSSIMCSLLV